MLNLKTLTLIALTLTVCGCANNYAEKSPAEVSGRMKVVDSEFDKSRLFAAPTVNGEGEGLLAPQYEAQLVAVQEKATRKVTHALRVSWTYVGQDWIFFSRAALPGADELKTAVGVRNVVSCSGRSCIHEENLTSELPVEVLAAASTGLRIRYSGQRGQGIVELPANYVAGYLSGAQRLASQ